MDNFSISKKGTYTWQEEFCVKCEGLIQCPTFRVSRLQMIMPIGAVSFLARQMKP